MENNFYWRNKVAVVTGASVGIGASTVLELANAGMVVIGLARRAELIEVIHLILIKTSYFYNLIKHFPGSQRSNHGRRQDLCPAMRS